MSGDGKWGWTALIGFTVALLHFAASLLALLSLLFSGMGSLSPLGRVFASLFTVLWFPLVLIIGRWTDGIIAQSNGTTLGLMMGNSTLWGLTIALLWRWWALRRPDRNSRP